MSIKDKIKEIENASEDLLVPEHDSKVAEAIGEKIHEVEDAAGGTVCDGPSQRSSGRQAG